MIGDKIMRRLSGRAGREKREKLYQEELNKFARLGAQYRRLEEVVETVRPSAPINSMREIIDFVRQGRAAAEFATDALTFVHQVRALSVRDRMAALVAMGRATDPVDPAARLVAYRAATGLALTAGVLEHADRPANKRADPSPELPKP